MQLPDHRRPNNNQRYTVGDAAMSALAVFFLQSPSFLAHQRALHTRAGQDNAETLFGLMAIPSDNQIRKLLDSLPPSALAPDFAWVHQQLAAAGVLAEFRDVAGTTLLAVDGVTYFSSTKIHCPECSERETEAGVRQYFHSAVTPVVVHPGRPQVLPLFPEFIRPQDGHTKQDCEVTAFARWQARALPAYPPHQVTCVFDALYTHQPTCQALAETYQQFFIGVVKPDSQTTLFDEVAALEWAGALDTCVDRVWNGRYGERWVYRWAEHLPLRADHQDFTVAWLELTITHEQTNAVLYHNTWATNHTLTSASVPAIARAGRARWKVENESNNTLKQQGYHLEHNFGHGHQGLALVLLTLNLLAFLLHTLLDCLASQYQQLRRAVGSRQAFFQAWRTLTQYFVFDSWDALFKLMCENHHIAFSQSPPNSE
jgi:hypothetical protein